MKPPLLTVFSAPKPFTDPHIAIIQRNAILSWLNLGEAVQVLLIGDEPGLDEVANEYGITHFREVDRNEWGTPVVSSIFSLARNKSAAPLLAYVNADILLMPDLVSSAQKVARQVPSFLIMGQRWDLDITEPLEFSAGWVGELRERVFTYGKLHPPAGSDYFIFPRDMFIDMPNFAIGRAGWDNWMIYHACKQGWAAVDATQDVMIVHQNHDYRHLPGGRPHYDQDESLQNIQRARDNDPNYVPGYMLFEANKILKNGNLVDPPRTLARLARRVELFILPKNRKGIRWWAARWLRKIRRGFLVKV